MTISTDGGLGDIAEGVDAAKATIIETEIGEALALIAAISDQDGDQCVRK